MTGWAGRIWANFARARLSDWRRTLAVCVAVVALFSSGFACGLYYLSKPPVVVISSYEENGVEMAGGDMNFINTKKDNALCRASVARWLWRPDPQDPRPDGDPRKRRQYRSVDSTLYAPPSVGAVSTYRLSVPLPQHLEPGYWRPLNIAVDVCPDGIHAPRFVEGKPILIEPAAPTANGARP